MIYRFGEFDVDTLNYHIQKNGVAVEVEPKVFDILVCLIANRQRLVTRDELFERVWSGQIVSDTALSNQIKAARRVIGDDGKTQCCIKTIHGRGYQFIASLKEIEDECLDNDYGLKQLQSVPDSITLPASYGPSIMVLPFKNLGSEQEQGFYAEGMSEDITTELCRFSDIRVISRHIAFQYKKDVVDLRELAEKIGVDYLVEGSVRRIGNALRIAVQLSETNEGTHLWAEKYDGNLSEVFQIQDEITGRVVSTLTGQIRRVETVRAKRRISENLTAYEHLLLGLSHHKNGYVRRIDFQNAFREFELAIELDPDFIRPKAWAICARAGAIDDSTPDFIDSSLAEAKRVLALDKTESESNRILGAIYIAKRNFDMGGHHLNEALRLSPNDSHIRMKLARYLNMTGQTEAAMKATRQAMALNPLHPGWYWLELGVSYYNLGEYQKALSAYCIIHIKYWDIAFSI